MSINDEIYKELFQEFFASHPEIVNIIEGYELETPSDIINAYNSLENFINEKDLKDSKIFNNILNSLKEYIVKNLNQEIKTNTESEKNQRNRISVRTMNYSMSILSFIFIAYYNNYCKKEETNEILSSDYVEELNNGCTARIRQREFNTEPDINTYTKRIRY